ncbi:transposase, MuDR, MULE transposase domain protein, partial [Tanacetum coccineum]
KKFPNVIEFRRALNHYAVINEFEYKIDKSDLERLTACCEDKKCEWRIHASTTEDKITFQVKKFVETHSCTRSNKCGNKRATQGWIANVIADKLKSDGDMSAVEIIKWLMKTYNVDVPYMRAFRGKEQAYTVMHACSRGFLAGCRPYISLDACHLKGRFNGVLAAAVSIDAIGTPNGLVISSDMQKGLEAAITQVYPDVEHRECMRHLYSNFKKQYRGDFFKFKLWGAANTCCVSKHDQLLEEIDSVSDARFRPVLDLLDAIREMLMNLGDYQVSRSSDNRAEVMYKGNLWEVLLDKKTCSCRVWQVKGFPCVHAATFIAFTWDAIWDSYVDPYFTIDKFKEAYALEIAPIPEKDQWVHIDTSEKIHPPIVKRPIGRPRKNRIVAHDETKRHRCVKCNGFGHHQKTCKNPPCNASTSQTSEPCQAPTRDE